MVLGRLKDERLVLIKFLFVLVEQIVFVQCIFAKRAVLDFVCEMWRCYANVLVSRNCFRLEAFSIYFANDARKTLTSRFRSSSSPFLCGVECSGSFSCVGALVFLPVFCFFDGGILSADF